VESSILKRATAAWWAGSEELNTVKALPGTSSAIGSRGVLPIGDARVERGALTQATAKLSTLLATLQTAITTTRAWGGEVAPSGADLPAQVKAVEEQTRHVRTLRQRYEARLGTGR
jgi:hypothetical protein